ncbi:hypothetical protein [Streptomyces sp. NPDC088261]|uniref:hypothetical protein n=1 Tax=Streptomyces sp. NPDC088261 TaxID=3365851 RepID=UPI0038247775
MPNTLATLYTRYAARLAAHVADVLDAAGADALSETDDVTQDVWLHVMQLDIPPSADQAWPVLTDLAAKVVDRHQGAGHRTREEPVGVRLPARPVVAPRPMPRTVQMLPAAA